MSTRKPGSRFLPGTRTKRERGIFRKGRRRSVFRLMKTGTSRKRINFIMGRNVS